MTVGIFFDDPFSLGTSVQAAEVCGNTSLGITPINDLGTGLYQGEQGGLYPGGSNTIPTAHHDLGKAIAATIEPLDVNGDPSASGNIVLGSVGVSNTRAIWSGQDTDDGSVEYADAFIPQMENDPGVNPDLIIANGGRGSNDVTDWLTNPQDNWDKLDDDIVSRGGDVDQLQILWFHVFARSQGLDPATEHFPDDQLDYQQDLEDLIRYAKGRYTNLKIIYLSSREYGGYSDKDTSNIDEGPLGRNYAYQSAWAQKWAIENQINGTGNLNPDPDGNPLTNDGVAPWLAWSAYLWADGLGSDDVVGGVPGRSDGLEWECSDFNGDGLHPGDTGVKKAADMLVDHFQNEPTACEWFNASGCPGDPTADAGDDQTVTDSDGSGDEFITLDGSNSSDPDGTIVSYEWKEGATVLGTGVTLNHTFAVGSHTVYLTVTDNDSNTDTDSVVITVDPQAPEQIFFDDFESGSLSPPWTESNEFDWTIEGEKEEDVPGSLSDNQVAHADNCDDFCELSLTSAIDLSGYGSASLSFWRFVDGALDSGEYLEVELWDGSSWNQIYFWEHGNGDDDTWNYETFDLVGYLVSDFNIRFTAKMSSTGEDAEIDDVLIEGVIASQDPTAKAGPDQTVTDSDGSGDEPVVLDGSGSSDPDGTIVSYEWKQGATVLGTTATLNHTFAVGSHTVDLTVTDNDSNTDTDSVVVTVDPNVSPAADAGVDQVAGDADNSGFEHLVLDASGSSDSDGVIVSYEWKEGATVLSTAASFGYDYAVGVHAVDLTVTDNGGATNTDQVVVTVNANVTPIADAGNDQTVIDSDDGGSELVTLDGSNSSDPDGTIVSYEWYDGATFLGTGVTLGHVFSVGSYVVDLIVVDNGGATHIDQVLITVDPKPNDPPLADAGADQNIQDFDGDGFELVTLDGSGSSDPDGTIVSYEWKQGATVLGVGVSFDYSFTVGVHAVDLTVTDDEGAAQVDQVLVTVSPTQSFKTQVVKMTIPASTDSVSATAPFDFESVDPDHTIALISGVTQHAMGWISTSTQDPVEISARVELVDGNTLVATRSSSSIAQSDEVWVLLIEYVGPVGGANEFVVRDRRVHGWSDGLSSVSYGPITTVVDYDKVVVFNAGTENANTSSSHYDRGDVRAYIDASKNVHLFRGDGTGDIESSHQVVEFTGSNWTIQTGDASPTPHNDGSGPDSGGTDVALTDVGDVSDVWVYFNWETASANLDERGHRVWLTSATNLRVQEHANATASKTIRWYVIQNPDLHAQMGAADDQFKDDTQQTVTGFAPVSSTEQSFAWMSGMTHGNGNAHPRDMWQFELLDDSTINLQRGRSGQNLDYYYYVVELP